MNERIQNMATVSVIIAGLNAAQRLCHERSVAGGWWRDPKTGEVLLENPMVHAAKIALMHSELSEGLEALRKQLPDSHLPHRPGIEVELADAIIRIFDLAGALSLDLSGALIEKLEYNAGRADHKPAARALANGKAF